MTSKFASRVLLGVLLAAEALAQGSRVRIYEPRSRSAEELAPLVAPLLGAEGAALADPQGGSLILQGEPAAIAEALAALETLDRAPQQFRIESEIRSRESVEGAFVRVGGWTDRGSFRIARIAAGAGGGERTRRVGASLVVLDGRTGEIWTGTSEPVPTGVGVALVPVQSGFRVRPRALGSGDIELEITPVLAERGPGGEIHETGAATQIRVAPGESLAIAGIGQSRGELGVSFPPGARAESGTSDSAIVVRVTPFETLPAARDRAR